METQEDVIVLVVVDDDEEENTIQKVKLEPTSLDDTMDENSVIEMVKKHGESVTTIKTEPPEDDNWDYTEDILMKSIIKSESIYNCLEAVNPEQLDDLYAPNLEDSEPTDEVETYHRKRRNMLKPWERRSFVAELTKEYPELRDDEELLVNTLEQIMRSVKPPPLPRDYYIMNGIMFECIQCGNFSDTIPTASRHYQEKHGERYLVCYACGVDFRSTTNLYKHEKRCIAPDAKIVLKARAASVGRKGRSRPYLKSHISSSKFQSAKKQTARFPCDLCSAVFMTRNNLQSHQNLHRGERPYRCHVCPAAYTSYSGLSRHKKKHTDVQFICDHCNRSFKIKTALVSHMDTHRPLRKHGCDECSRRFAQKSALLLHINRVHRNLPPPCACQICPKRYPRMSLLRDHMKRAHGMTIMTRKMFFKSLPTMTDLELKESKVILKIDDDILNTERPYNTEEMFKECLPENISIDDADSAEIQQSEYNEESRLVYSNEEEISDGDKVLKEFMQYVKVGTEGLGDNVIYIENGEVVQGFQCSSKNLRLQVEDLMEES